MDYNKRIKKSGMKKTWIASQIGISNVLLSYYINGTRPMPDVIQKKLKAVLDKLELDTVIYLEEYDLEQASKDKK